MKKLFSLIIIAIFICTPIIASAQWSKEVLELKRDLANEKILRIQAEYQIMSGRLVTMQDEYTKLQSELNGYDKMIEEMNQQPETESVPQPSEVIPPSVQ